VGSIDLMAYNGNEYRPLSINIPETEYLLFDMNPGSAQESQAGGAAGVLGDSDGLCAAAAIQKL
jgi:hypothetical protein